MGNDRVTTGTSGVGSLFASGTAYVSIPDNQDREMFIKKCFKTQTLFIRGESGESFKDVFISKNLLHDIDFPENSKSRGSLVTWVKQPKHNVPIVVGVFDLKNNMSYITKERQVRFQRKSKSGNIVDFDGSADDASLDINVSSSEDDKGIIRFKINNPNQTAKMEVYVSGEIDVFADKKIRIASNEELLLELVKQDGSSLATISYKNGVGLALKDEYNNEIVTKSKSLYLKEGSGGGLELEVTDKLINLGTIGGASEPGVLGNKNETALNDIKGMLQKLITLITQISTQDAAGVATLSSSYGVVLNYVTLMASTASQLITDLAQLTADIPQTKSTKVKTD